MNILIIEDEIKTAKALGHIIKTLRPTANITAYIQSIEAAVIYLSENVSPDLIFMDIQLADGLCFEIFKNVKINSPVIFCTAFGDYTMDAFKANGIDYILKPFTKESIAEAMEKVDQLKNFFQTNNDGIEGLENILQKIGAAQSGKTGFLVFKNNKYTTVSIENIAFFYIHFQSTMIMTFNNQQYSITQSLDEVYKELSSNQFFRINRQYLINFKAVKEVEHYFARKLLVILTIPTDEKLLIGKDKTSPFLQWLENR
tara:strand:+ start:20161 stop:20931 length:771 start_codon:yes stop_codon:yes gene_type:complete